MGAETVSVSTDMIQLGQVSCTTLSSWFGRRTSGLFVYPWVALQLHCSVVCAAMNLDSP